jgi:hypothetical protein
MTPFNSASDAFQLHPRPRGIAETLTGLTRSALEKYDEDAGYFDATVRNAKRRELASRLVLALRKIVAKHLTHVKEAVARDAKDAIRARR